MPIVQPSVAKRLTFARWARTNGYNRTSSVTWAVSDLSEVPPELLEGAAVDGKVPSKTTGRRRRTQDKREAVTEPGAPTEPEHEPEFPVIAQEEATHGDLSETS